jgi:hypothetical protein
MLTSEKILQRIKLTADKGTTDSGPLFFFFCQLPRYSVEIGKKRLTVICTALMIRI